MNAIEAVPDTVRGAPGLFRPPPRPAAEDDLLDALAEGRREAAERLVEATYQQIYQALHRMCGGDPDLAADLTQETYRRAWAGLDGFRGRARFSTWLYRIAYTTYLNHIRRPRRLTPLDEEAAERLADPRPGQESEAAGHGEAARLRRAVMKLPEDLRFTVAARFWGELPAAEIARQEGVTPVAIRKRLRRAYRLLETSLAEEVGS